MSLLLLFQQNLQAAPDSSWQPAYPAFLLRAPDANRWAGTNVVPIRESLYNENQPETAATTTTWCDVRDAIIAELEALTPTLLPQHLFRHVHRRYTVRQFANQAGSPSLRKFDLRRDTREARPYHAAQVAERRERAMLTVSYPTTLGLYGRQDYDEMERVIRSDARQIRDAITSVGNYAAGQFVAAVDFGATETSGIAWYQTYAVRVEFLESLAIV